MRDLQQVTLWTVIGAASWFECVHGADIIVN